MLAQDKKLKFFIFHTKIACCKKRGGIFFLKDLF